ncbi:MAG: hypothetical protein ACSHW2_07155 [Parasphingopyxis sp.]
MKPTLGSGTRGPGATRVNRTTSPFSELASKLSGGAGLTLASDTPGSAVARKIEIRMMRWMIPDMIAPHFLRPAIETRGRKFKPAQLSQKSYFLEK